MGCTCRAPAMCPICNMPVRVPLSNLDSATAGGVLVDRFARRDSSANREGIRRLVEGWTNCPGCGQTIRQQHSRSCVAEALTVAGVPLNDRESILAKITFPEG